MNKVVNKVADSVIQFTKEKEKIMSFEIREKILSELDLIAPKVSFEWRKFMNARNKY
jgi:hypothetical protein